MAAETAGSRPSPGPLVAGAFAALIAALGVPAQAGGGTCDHGALAAGIDGMRQLDPVERVAKAAGALEGACRGYGRALETAGDVSVVSPERRRPLDLALGAKAEAWRALCPAGPRALREVTRMTHQEGRAHLWDACGLGEQPALAGVSRDEWVGRLEGMLILPLEAAVMLQDSVVDEDLAEIVIRGLVGLAPRAPSSPAGGGAPAGDAAAVAGPEDLPSLEEVLAGMGGAAPDPTPVGPVSPALDGPLGPVPVPVHAPAPAPALEPALAVPEVPEPAPAPVPESRPPEKRPSPSTVRARFKDGGQASAKWSKEALATGGSCVVRIRVGANGKMQRIAFLECPDPLKADVHAAAERSRYLPASEGEFPVAGAFRTRWVVESAE